MARSKRDPFDDVEKWESGELGRSEEHAVRADSSAAAELDAAIGMRAISIRLPIKLIEQYKVAAELLGKGYQPLMRDAIERLSKVYLEEASRVLAQKIEEAEASDKRRTQTEKATEKKAA
jgi:hypothetical protein